MVVVIHLIIIQWPVTHCTYTDVNKKLKVQLIQSCTSSRPGRRVLREPDTSLDDEHWRSSELSEQQAAGMERGVAASVNAERQKHHVNDHVNAYKWHK